MTINFTDSCLENKFTAATDEYFHELTELFVEAVGRDDWALAKQLDGLLNIVADIKSALPDLQVAEINDEITAEDLRDYQCI